MRAHVRELAPDGVDAVFDHVGGPGIVDSWRMLARGGTLVSYGTASTPRRRRHPRVPVLKLVARLLAWNRCRTGGRATSSTSGPAQAQARPFRAGLRADLSQVFALLADGVVKRRSPTGSHCREAVEAMRLAESGTVTGKVVLEP